MNDTPETDDAARTWMGDAMRPWNLARKLERDRDDLRRQLDAECKSTKNLTNELMDLQMENELLRRGIING